MSGQTQPRRWAAIPHQELSGWVGSDDTHWMSCGGPGLHIGTGPKPNTCSICRDGCDWTDCSEPPTEMLTGRAVIERPATLLEPATEESEPVVLRLCAEHTERVRAEPVVLEPLS